MFDSVEMARRGRLAVANGLLKRNCESAALVNRGNKSRGEKISKALRKTLAMPEVKHARSERAQKQWESSAIRAKMSHAISLVMAGKKQHRSAVSRARQSAKIKESWTAERRQEAREFMLSKRVDGRLPHLKYADTKPELAMKTLLDARGVEYQQQVRMFGILWDFVIASERAIIEVDGCYWHSCPIHHPNRDSSRMQLGKKRTQQAEEAGWRVIRIWEHDLTARKP
jgi:DNA mismatch endonuclease (patch repair protein)